MQVLDEISERLPELFDMEDIRNRVDDFNPYVMVAIQVSACHPMQLAHDGMDVLCDPHSHEL